jgi:hypothetical protein
MRSISIRAPAARKFISFFGLTLKAFSMASDRPENRSMSLILTKFDVHLVNWLLGPRNYYSTYLNSNGMGLRGSTLKKMDYPASGTRYFYLPSDMIISVYFCARESRLY